MTPAPAFKFVCVTDLHLVPAGRMLKGLDPAERLRACVEDIAAHHADAALCVVLGDLTHLAEPGAYDLLRDCLRALPMPVRLMIGNHDRRAAARAAFPDLADDGRGFVQQAFDTPAGRFLLLDTLNEGSSAGRYCPARLGWLRNELRLAGQRPVFLFMHHPPFDCGIPSLDRIRLRDDAALHALLAGHRNIRHLFLGHVHRPMSGSWAGIPFSSTRGTNHQVPLDLHTVDHVPHSHEPPSYAVVFADEARVVVHFHDYLDRTTLSRDA